MLSAVPLHTSLKRFATVLAVALGLVVQTWAFITPPVSEDCEMCALAIELPEESCCAATPDEICGEDAPDAPLACDGESCKCPGCPCHAQSAVTPASALAEGIENMTFGASGRSDWRGYRATPIEWRERPLAPPPKWSV